MSLFDPSRLASVCSALVCVLIMVGCTEHRGLPGGQQNNGTADAGDDASSDAGDRPDGDRPDSGDATPPPDCDTTADCPVISGLAPTCTDGVCDTLAECADGYIDLTASLGDGCETRTDDAVFVSSDADPAGSGLSPDEPLPSIQQGLALASEQERDHVLVAAGTYEEPIAMKAVALYGGFDASNWQRDPTQNESIVRPAEDAFDTDERHYRTVTADGLDAAALIDGLTLVGVSPSGDGARSTYVVWASNADDHLTIRGSKLVAGDATNGAAGQDGRPGASRDCDAAGGAGGPTNGVRPCSQPPNATAPDGEAGEPAPSGGEGGQGGAHSCSVRANRCDPGDGKTGEDGAEGQPGEHGSTPDDNLGSFVGGLWSPPLGAPATDGLNGSGGGGGGTGGSCEFGGTTCGTLSDCLDKGGPGGSGGEGGCAGAAAGNGETGGASFGLVAIASTVTLSDCDISLGSAGDGGDGGDGGEGAQSGVPQPGNFGDSARAGKGGDGGFGGKGGSGGAGAGGCGGPSVGVALVDAGSLEATHVSFDDDTRAAEGGSGGETPISHAPDGCEGAVSQTLEFDAP